MAENQDARVVIVGGGFGGLAAAKAQAERARCPENKAIGLPSATRSASLPADECLRVCYQLPRRIWSKHEMPNRRL
jgi:hypothetical protein